MSVDFKGYHEEICTFYANEATKTYPVKMHTASATVTNCTQGNNFIGFCESIRGGYAAVQLQGYRQVPFSGTAPATGYQMLAADGKGGLKTVETGGKTCLVVSVTEDTIGIIF